MTIATNAELKLAIANWLGRDDIADARLSEFVALFEAVANRALRVRQQETSTTLTPTSGAATLPTDYLNWRKVAWAGPDENRVLEYVSPEFFQAAYVRDTAQSPNIFTIEGSTLKVNSSEDEDLTFHYYQKIPSLLDNTSNWLLDAHPDLYLYGSLVESEMFLVNDERALSWKSRRDELFEEVRQLSNRSRGAGRVRLVQATP